MQGVGEIESLFGPSPSRSKKTDVSHPPQPPGSGDCHNKTVAPFVDDLHQRVLGFGLRQGCKDLPASFRLGNRNGKPNDPSINQNSLSGKVREMLD